MDYTPINLIVLVVSCISLLITLLSIDLSMVPVLESDPDANRPAAKIGAIIIFVVQVILILARYKLFAYVMICLYIPGLVLAKYHESNRFLNLTKPLFFYGLLFFGVSLSYLIAPTTTSLKIPIPPDLLFGGLIFAIAGGIYLILLAIIGVPSGRTGFRDIEGQKEIRSFFFIAAFHAFSILFMIVLIFDRHWVRQVFDLLILFLTVPLIITAVIPIILLSMGEKKYIIDVISVFLYFGLYLGFLLLSFVINYRGLFFHFYILSIILIGLATFLMIIAWIKERRSLI